MGTLAARSSRLRLYPQAAAQLSRTRVIVVIPARGSRWLLRLVDLLLADEQFETDILVLEGEGEERNSPVLPFDLRAYLWLDRKRAHSRMGPLHTVDLAEGLRVRDVVVERIAPGGLVARLGEPTLALVALPHGQASAIARESACACWCIGDSLTDPAVAGLAFLAPILRDELATTAELRLAATNGAPESLARANGPTKGGSFGLQRDTLFSKLPSLLMRSLRRVASGQVRPEPGEARLLEFAPESPVALVPGVGARAFFAALRKSIAWRRRQRKGGANWFLAVRRADAPMDLGSPHPGAMEALQAPKGLYWADPCIVEDGQRRFVFVEEYIESEQRGVIACIELLPRGARRLGIVLDRAYHLSYPIVFDHEGVRYMTVESGAAGRVSLYRAEKFPLFWVHERDLIEGGVCVDPTLYHHDGLWYLFASAAEGGSSTSDELFLFTAESLDGPFEPHPCNPIVQDVRRARPAGRLVRHGGRLIRPAQDCAPEYGSAVAFNEIVELDRTRYHERPLSRLEPSWQPGLWGCHTYSAVPGVEVLDASGFPVAAMTGTVAIASPDPADLISATPLVTALMPVYNGERFLAEAIESVLAQTFEGVEVVVVNDGSTDSSGAIADRYAAEHPGRVRVVHQENRGLPLARNAAIEVARGRYFALLDADDVWLPNHIEDCVAVLENDPGIGLVHADAEDIDENGRVVGPRTAGRWQTERDPFSEILLRYQHVTCPTAVFRRSVVERVGAFDARFNRLGCEDRDQWLRIALASRLHYIDALHAQYRVHGNNMSANSARMWQARSALVEKFAENSRGHVLRTKALAALDAERGHELAVEAPVWPALRSFLKALSRDPLRVDAWKGLIRRILVGRRAPSIMRP